MTTKQVLVKARKLLVEKGWCRGYNRDSHGRHCAWGAIVDTSSNEGALMIARHVVEEAAGYNSIIAWNDDPKRTKLQVLRAFDKAIAKVSNGKGK